ncbi:MAG: universal stress protein [SAR324 cluster bacterium]|nr:universal stress protein [SAR324 cluster bacterium]
MKKRIIVPIDYSEVSKEVVKFADDYAQKTNANLYFLHIEPHHMLELEGDQSSLLNHFDHYLKQFKIVSNYQISVEFGVPYLEIVELSKTLNPELIIMAAHSHTLLGRLFLGSNTDYVIHHCGGPVYVYRKPLPELENKIIVPIDYTEVNKNVIELADIWAQETGAELYFIHTDPVPESLGDRSVLENAYRQGKLELNANEMLVRKREGDIAALQKGFELYLDELELKSAFHRVFEIGKPYLEIQALQQRTKARLIMMAAHSHTLLNRLFVGSNTDYLMHHLDCPLFIYKENA